MLTTAGWICAILLALLIVALFAGIIFGGWRDRKEETTAKEEGIGGADESWGDTVEMIVKEISNEGPPTIEVDMAELNDRLALDDVEDATKKQAYRVIDEAVAILTDDEAWIKYLAGRRSEEVQNV